ncbi:transmission-blocking target antigen s230 paralog, putative [Plasmodium malariae]|uniref:Transmission-blocking target antigen s230 paralog, putative n=1 Tax=Plasmodium malariae TaxID=5858 RepID=A0A1A8VPY3_PLAMA|nr:transmission-blocking target antigen s230 paralog, putative [Plasmodium malariae]
MRKKKIICYFCIYSIFIFVLVNYDHARYLWKRGVLYNFKGGGEKDTIFSPNCSGSCSAEGIDKGEYRDGEYSMSGNIRQMVYKYMVHVSRHINKYIYELYTYLFQELRKRRSGFDHYRYCYCINEGNYNCSCSNGCRCSGSCFCSGSSSNCCSHHFNSFDRENILDKKCSTLSLFKGRNIRKLAVEDGNPELEPYVKREEKNTTIVNLHDYFAGGVKKNNGKNEIFVSSPEKLHRVVVICNKPSLNYSHIITRPTDALNKMFQDGKGEILTEEEYPVIFYVDEANWGLKNELSKGMVELIIPSYSRRTGTILISCANYEIDETYKFEDLIHIRIVVPRSSSKILGVSTNPKDKNYFEQIVDEHINDYNLGSYKNRVLGLKLEDTELDPHDCFKSVYENDIRVHLEVEYPYAKCIKFDRPNYKIRFFFLPSKFSDDELEFTCTFTYKKKKMKVTFGEGETTTIKEVAYLEEDKEKFDYFNSIPYKICNFEYNNTDDVIHVCERTINEFSLFVYNCELDKSKQVGTGEPISTIKYLNNTYTIQQFTNIALYTDHINIDGIKDKFPNFKFFMTSYIDHGPYPLVIECSIPNGRGKYQEANIFLHVRTDLKEKSSFFCDFNKGSIYNYLNAYQQGDTCEITASSNTSIGFRCPQDTVKKPDTCFKEVYYYGKLSSLSNVLAENLIIYSSTQENIALAAFNDTLTRSYTMECFCVRKEDRSKIVKTVIVKYINPNEIYDYNIHEKIIHPPIIMNPYKTHLCDFMTNTSILIPTFKKPKNYLCDVYPNPLDYVALKCPSNLVDAENEKEIANLSEKIDKEGVRDQMSLLFKKRNIYTNLFHVPKDAPSYVINKDLQDVTPITSLIPGVLVKDIINIKITTIREEDEERDESTDHPPTIPVEDVNKIFERYTGLRNSVQNGLFIFQLPPYIKKDQIIEFSCINGKTEKKGLRGNNGIMTVYIRSSGEIIDGCYFYKNHPEVNYLKNSIKAGSGKECIIQSDGEIEYIGVMCSSYGNLFLTPSDCFSHMYDSSDVLIPLTDKDKDFKVFSNDKGISYLKIPQSFLGHLSLFCYCNSTVQTGGTNIVKENKIHIELNTSNKGVSTITKIDHLYESDFLIGHEYIDRKPTPILRRKHICDFTKKESSLSPTSEQLSINTCFVELEDNLNIVEVKCPPNTISDSASALGSDRGRIIKDRMQALASQRTGFYTPSSGFTYSEERITKEELKKYEKMKYIPDNYDEIIHMNSKKKLEDVLPGVIIFDRNRLFAEKGYFTFASSLIVKKDITIKLYCDNSHTVIENKKGKKGITVVKIMKNITDKTFYGCDFSGNAKKTFYYSGTYNLKEKSHTCEIELKENSIISLNCPNGKINPSNCFSNVYIKSSMDQEITENIENIFNHIKVINTSYLINSSSTFLIISKITKNEIDFYCTCEDIQSKHVGTIYIKNLQRSSTSKKHDAAQIVYIDVTPYYLRDTYICDFTEHHYSIALNNTEKKKIKKKNIDFEKLLESYLDLILNQEYKEFTHFSLNLKLRKEHMKEQYVNYVKKKINDFKENPIDMEPYTNYIIVYRCNVDLSAFDKFAIICPKKTTTSSSGEVKFNFENLKYTSNLGLDENSMLEGLNNILFGTLLINKKRNVSFFEKGEIELIISPYADSSKNIIFSCENLEQNSSKGIIGSASIFIKKSDTKILGCDFQDVHYTTTTSSYPTSTYDPAARYKKNKKKDSFEFEIELIEGKKIYCNIEAIQNDVVGFSCPYNFLTSPQNCFESVQIEGLDKELETHKLETLVSGVKVLNNEIYDYNYTPSYIIIPKKVQKSLKIFCTCNSVNLIKTGIIQINIIGDDLNNWFKKEINHNIYAFQKMSYFYDFSSGALNISSENVLNISTLSLQSHRGMLNMQEITNEHVTDEIKKRSKINLIPNYPSYDRDYITNGSYNYHTLKGKEQGGVYTGALNKGMILQERALEGAEEEEEEEEDREGSLDAVRGQGEENILNPLRTKHVFEITIAASEFSIIKVVCPLRNALQFRQSKISPENFFEHVYVLEDKHKKKRKRSYAENEKFITELVQGGGDVSKASVEDRSNIGSKSRNTEEPEEIKGETKVEYDEMGNKIITSVTSKKPKATLEDAEKLYEESDMDNRDILIIKSIEEVISFVNYEREIGDNTYSGILYLSPLLLNEASFFITCDNSLTLNESKRGKTGIVKINVNPNFLKMHGCDFVGDYSTHFYFSAKWNSLPKDYVCEIKVEDDSIVGLACPAHTKMHPSDCFQSVIKDDEVYKKEMLIEEKYSFFYKKNNKPLLSFIQIKQVYSDHFICKCYENENGQSKEVTIKVLYEPYTMGRPKNFFQKAIIKKMSDFAEILLPVQENEQLHRKSSSYAETLEYVFTD